MKTAILALNDQITVSFVRAAGALAKGRMRPAGRIFDMPNVYDITAFEIIKFIKKSQIYVVILISRILSSGM
jgi:hypothetical protein